jgi:formylglycine-generating enzyme required for sulfatase activity
MGETRKLRVFVCHGLQDKQIVHLLYERLLKEDWIEPWLDEEKLLPGQDRELNLGEVLKSTDVALVCLSKQSLDEEGGFQREIRIVVDFAKEKPENSIFIIPIRLDNCEKPQYLRSKQHVNFFSPSDVVMEQAYLRIRKSMKIKFELISGKMAESRSLHWVSSNKLKVVDDLADLDFGGFRFVKIPKGKFIMGSRASNNLSGDDEHPERPYEIPYNYWITLFPISNEQFSEYAVSTRHIEFLPKDWKNKLDEPIVNVSWHEVVEYTKWLNKIFKKEIPNELVFRLPTEAEWERASRGDLGFEWPWENENLDEFLDGGSPKLLARLKNLKHLDEKKNSNDFAKYHASNSRANFSEVGNDRDKSALNLLKMTLDGLRRSMELTDVGTFSPVTDSQFEVADMMGSVWEWTQSLYKLYPYDVDDGRENLGDSGERVIRGCFMTGSERFSVRSARRAHATPDTKRNHLGVRIVVAPPV